MSNPHPKRNLVPKAVLKSSGFKTLNTGRQNSSRAVVSVNTARQINTAYPRPTVNSARPVSNVFNRAHSHDKRPINNITTSKNSKINQKVNTVRAKHVNTTRPKVNTARPKAEKEVIDSGCFRHMTGNMFYLSEYEESDGRYVAFEEDPKRGKITTDTKCVVLYPDFKLLDESQVLLRDPRKNNMYSVDLKNVAPSGGNQSNGSAGKARVETVPDKDYILLPLWTQDPLFSSSSKDSLSDGFKSLWGG
nr:ribonuclease H-like domain-containing protein [Tanacetum cinerariifolium]